MESIVDILSQGRDREAQASKIHGFVVGIVTNNKDPDKLGRVKVKFPWLSDTVESWWARVCYPMAGQDRGFWFIPDIHDEVLIGFEHGDVRFPCVIGSLYNGVDKPAEANKVTSKFAGTGYDHGAYSVTDFNDDGKNNLRFIKSRSGHVIVFDDSDSAGAQSGDAPFTKPGGGDKGKITIADNTGKHRIEVFTKDKRIVITSEDGDIELIAQKKILMRCDDLETYSRKSTKMTADTTFDAKSKKDMSHKTDANLTQEAAKNVSQKASSGNFDAEAGKNITVKGGMNATMQATAAAKVDGKQTTLSGTATVTISGGMVNIN